MLQSALAAAALLLLLLGRRLRPCQQRLEQRHMMSPPWPRTLMQSQVRGALLMAGEQHPAHVSVGSHQGLRVGEPVTAPEAPGPAGGPQRREQQRTCCLPAHQRMGAQQRGSLPLLPRLHREAFVLWMGRRRRQ